MLQAWLRSTVNISEPVVRNAAQGTTSQLVSAPCIQALVGDCVDLLLWEFALNDEIRSTKKSNEKQMDLGVGANKNSTTKD